MSSVIAAEDEDDRREVAEGVKAGVKAEVMAEVKAEVKGKEERDLPPNHPQSMNQSNLQISSAGVVVRKATGPQLAHQRLYNLWMQWKRPTFSSLPSKPSDQKMKTASLTYLTIQTLYQCWCQDQRRTTTQYSCWTLKQAFI